MNNQVKADSKTRHLSTVFTARDSQDGDGVKLKRVFSFQANQGGESLDPFLLLDEFASDDAADYVGGFPDHPHRGFETVTYMLAGRMEHRDHLGNRGELVPGAVQWMTAASGIIHSEMPLQEKGRMQGFQLWINLPAAEKMRTPEYQEYRPEQIPVYTLDNGVTIKAIAGSVEVEERLIKGPVSGIATDPTYMDIAIPPHTELKVPVAANHSLLTYLFDGELQDAGGSGRQNGSLIRGQLGKWSEGDHIEMRSGEAGARLLLLAAKPINEPVVQYGPFVMNTHAEIKQAISDYQSGRLIQKQER